MAAPRVPRSGARLMDSVDKRKSVPQETTPCSTPDLVARQQFAERVDRTSATVYRYVVNRLKRHYRDVAEDLTQATFAKAWESSSTFDPGKDELAWLLAIVQRRKRSFQEHLWR